MQLGASYSTNRPWQTTVEHLHRVFRTLTLPARFNCATLPLSVDSVQLDLAVIHRAGPKAPILFLHGFGSTKEDYADITLQPAFDGHPFIAYDAPGCGETWCSDLRRINIGFLVKTARAVLAHFHIARFHLVGHYRAG